MLMADDDLGISSPTNGISIIEECLLLKDRQLGKLLSILQDSMAFNEAMFPACGGLCLHGPDKPQAYIAPGALNSTSPSDNAMAKTQQSSMKATICSR